MFDPTSNYHGLAKLTHKISHHRRPNRDINEWGNVRKHKPTPGCPLSFSVRSHVGLVRGSFSSSQPASEELPFSAVADSCLVLRVCAETLPSLSLWVGKNEPSRSPHTRPKTGNRIYCDNYYPSHSRKKTRRETDLYSFRGNPCQLPIQTNTGWFYT